MNPPRLSPEQRARQVVDLDAVHPDRYRRSTARTVQSRLGGELTMAELVWTLVQGRWMILAVAGAVLALSAAYLLFATPIYQSSVLIQVEERTKPGAGLEDLSTMLSSAAPSETELEAMRSRSLLGTVVDQLGLDIDVRPRVVPLIGKAIAGRYRGSGPAPAPFGLVRYAWGGERVRVQRLSLTDDLRDMPLVLTALDGERYQLATDDGIILVAGEVNEPASASVGGRRVELLVTELVARPGTEVIVEKMRRAAVIEGLQDDLQVVEKGRKTGLFLISLNGPDPARIASILGSIATTYQRQHIEQRAAEAAKTLEFLESQFPILKGNVDTAGAAMNAYRLDRGTVDLTRETTAMLERSAAVERALLELDMQMAELRQRFKESHPSVQSLFRKADTLRAERAAMQNRLREMPETERDTARLARDVKVSSELYAHLLNKAQELRVAKAGTMSNVRIVDEVTVPERPVSPKRSAILLLALLLGLGAGVGTVIVRKALEEGADDPHEIEDATGIPVYVTVPRSLKQAGIARAIENAAGRRTPILAEVDPGDAALEALRSLRTSLQLALGEASTNVIAISSPSPGVGKTFVSLNLAHVLAAAKCRVVLVDGDLRRGQVHKPFGFGRRPGLSDVVLGHLPVTAALRHTNVEGLDVLTTGRIPPNPAELLASSTFPAIIAELSRSYDLVLIDTPPVLAVTDPTLVARLAGVNLIVLRAGLHPLREIALAVEQFRQRGTTVNGIILNDARSVRGRYGRYGKYYRYEYRSTEHE